MWRSIWIVLLCFLLGCITLPTDVKPERHSKPAQKRLVKYHKVFNPWLGVARRGTIRDAFGDPVKKIDLMDGTIHWHYKFYYGTKRIRMIKNYGAGTKYAAYATGEEIVEQEITDEIIFVFKDGVLTDWTGSIHQ